MLHGTAARFLITCLEPAGAAMFAMLKCRGGDKLLQQPWETRLNTLLLYLRTVNPSLVPTGSPQQEKINS